MIVKFPANYRSGHTGKANFLRRLVGAMRELSFNVKIVESGKCDLALTLFKPPKTGYGPRNIARVDGVYYSTKNDERNKPIGAHLSRCDGIIYQSKFSRGLIDNFIKPYYKIRAKEKVIRNGCDIRQGIIPIKSNYPKNAICCARWRRHKRLKESVKLCLSVDDLCLWVVGDADYKVKHERIKYLGIVHQKELPRYYAMADVLIHLCPFDNSPNSVVEAIACGTPVLATRSGGAPELIDGNGIISRAEKPFSFRPTNVDKPPKIDMNVLRIDLNKILCNNIKVDPSKVDINNIARKYYDFFRKILGE